MQETRRYESFTQEYEGPRYLLAEVPDLAKAMAMAEEKRVVELGLQMDKSGRPPGNEEHDSPSVNDNIRSFFSLAAKRRYSRLGKDEADGEQLKIAGGLKTMPFIIGNETCEKLAVVGVQANMMVYLITKYNMKKVAATSMLNTWSGTMGLATLPGAFLADSYIGRFGMITIGCFSYVLAMFILTLTAIIRGLLPSSCSATDQKLNNCESASAGQFALLVLFFAFMAGGSAGTRPSVMAFGADQFGEGGEREKRRLQSYFNWYYFAGRVAVIIAFTVVVYIQSDVSWGFGFSLCTAFMLMSSIFFLLGAPSYRHEIPQGSALTGFAHVIVASVKKRNLPLPPDSLHLHHGEQSSCDKPCLTNQFRFLNKAAIMSPGHTRPTGTWRVCSVEKIEGLKSVIRTLPIFSCGIANQITNAQQQTFSVLQALSMDRRIGSKGFKIPAGSFSVFSLLVLIAWLPFYDRVVVPYARRNTKNNRGISVFQRLGIGFAISSLSMLVAGLVEVKRRNAARTHGLIDQPSAVVPISALWLLPQFCIYGLAEAFYAVGHLEFFYDQFPATMRSTAIAMSWCMTALGNYLSAVIVNVIHNTTGRDGQPDWLDDNLNRGHLEYFYWLLSGLEALNLVYFIICTGKYKHRDPLTGAEAKPDASSGCHEIEFECMQE